MFVKSSSSSSTAGSAKGSPAASPKKFIQAKPDGVELGELAADGITFPGLKSQGEKRANVSGPSISDGVHSALQAVQRRI